MPVSFYFDQNVPVAVAEALRVRDVDVLRTHDDGTGESSDDELLERATELGRAIFSQDRDFLRIASEWAEAGRPHAGIVYAHQLSAPVGSLVRDLELIAKAMDADELRDALLFLPL